MTKLETKVRALFEAYAKFSDDALQDPPREDVDGVAAAFAPYFVGSSPRGVMGGANDEQFRAMIPQGFARYRAIGGKHMTIKGLKVTELDHCHAIADVDWDFAYIDKAGQSGHLTFTNFYFVTTAGGAAKVFGYVTPDEEQAMRDHGLV